MDHRRHLVNNVGSSYGFSVIAYWASHDREINRAKVGTYSLEDFGHLIRDRTGNPLLKTFINPLTTSRMEEYPLAIPYIEEVTEPLALPDPSILGGLTLESVKEGKKLGFVKGIGLWECSRR